MNKREWYRNRILWRAGQHQLLEKRCTEYTNLRADQRQVIESALPKDADPVLVFWSDVVKWTVLGTGSIYSLHDGQVAACDLDAINKQLRICRASDETSTETKANASFVEIEGSGTVIWVPPGEELFALMNILMMFPLKPQSCSNAIGE